MKNLQPLPEQDPIDPTFADTLAALHDIDATLFDAQCGYREAQSITERRTMCAQFAGALYELEGAVTYLQKYLAHMREGVTAVAPGRVIRPRRWSQPRDAHGRFIKRAALPE